MQTREQARRHLRVVPDLPEAGDIPNFHKYDLVVVNSSGGKDSSVQAWWVHRVAVAQGYPLDRVVVLHADLGDDVEWEGTTEVARAQAEQLGLAFHVCSRIGGTAQRDSAIYKKGERYGDMLDYALRRGKWYAMGTNARYCTSEFKRGPCNAWIKAYCAQRFGRKVAVLNCMGMRSDESPGRKKMPQFERNERASNRTVKFDNWLPVKHWTEAQVWECIEREGLPRHPAYELGMPRLSCVFCVYAPRSVLKLAAKHNRKMLDRYVEVENTIDHAFTQDSKTRTLVWLRDIRDELDAGDDGVDTSKLTADWNM